MRKDVGSGSGGRYANFPTNTMSPGGSDESDSFLSQAHRSSRSGRRRRSYLKLKFNIFSIMRNYAHNNAGARKRGENKSETYMCAWKCARWGRWWIAEALDFPFEITLVAQIALLSTRQPITCRHAQKSIPTQAAMALRAVHAEATRQLDTTRNMQSERMFA
jgi:hypothetical protein